MGVISSKCVGKQAVNTSDLCAKYEKLETYAKDKSLSIGGDNCVRQTKEEERTAPRSTEVPTRPWEILVPEDVYTEKCKHSKSLSLTAQNSPKSTASTDGDDVGSISTLTSMLENPLLKRAGLDNPLIKRVDRELRPVGPVHPFKLGKDKNQVRLELEETGLIKSNKSDRYIPNIDPTEEGIIGDLRSVGIISNISQSYAGPQETEFRRKLPPRLTHLTNEAGKSKTKLPFENSGLRGNTCEPPVTSKSEEEAGCTSVVEPNNSEPTLEVHENHGKHASESKEITNLKREIEQVELKIKLINSDIL